jgi:hypothetical protein
MLEALFNLSGGKTQEIWLAAQKKGGPWPTLFASVGRFVNRPYMSIPSSSSIRRVKFFARPAGAIMP